MNFIKHSIQQLDLFASPLLVNFEDGLVTQNKMGKTGARVYKHALGHSVQSIKNKMAVKIRQKFSRESCDPTADKMEGGAVDEDMDVGSLEKKLTVGYSP